MTTTTSTTSLMTGGDSDDTDDESNSAVTPLFTKIYHFICVELTMGEQFNSYRTINLCIAVLVCCLSVLLVPYGLIQLLRTLGKGLRACYVVVSRIQQSLCRILSCHCIDQYYDCSSEEEKEKREGRIFQECRSSSSSSRSTSMLQGSVGAHHPQQQQLRQRKPVTSGTVDSRQQQQQQQQQYQQFFSSLPVVVQHNEQQQHQKQQQKSQQQHQHPSVIFANAADDEVPLTVPEQEWLTGMMNNLAPEKFIGVLHIMLEGARRTGDDGDDENEIDVDLDQFDTATQRKLFRYVTHFYKPTGTTSSPSTTCVPGTTSTNNPHHRPVIGSLSGSRNTYYVPTSPHTLLYRTAAVVGTVPVVIIPSTAAMGVPVRETASGRTKNNHVGSRDATTKMKAPPLSTRTATKKKSTTTVSATKAAVGAVAGAAKSKKKKKKKKKKKRGTPSRKTNRATAVPLSSTKKRSRMSDNSMDRTMGNVKNNATTWSSSPRRPSKKQKRMAAIKADETICSLQYIFNTIIPSNNENNKATTSSSSSPRRPSKKQKRREAIKASKARAAKWAEGNKERVANGNEK